MPTEIDLGTLPELVLTPEIVPTTTQFENHTLSVIKDISGAKSRPSYLSQDVWDIREEFIKKGGLADLSEQLASFASMEQDVRNSDLSLTDRTRLLIQINQQAAAAKVKYVQIQEKLRNFITYDVFSLFLEELNSAILEEVIDPLTVKRLGVRLAKAAKRLATEGAGG